jgi:hypothetical protein
LDCDDSSTVQRPTHIIELGLQTLSPSPAVEGRAVPLIDILFVVEVQHDVGRLFVVLRQTPDAHVAVLRAASDDAITISAEVDIRYRRYMTLETKEQ